MVVSEPTHELRWSAPETCPTQSEVAAQIEGLLGLDHTGGASVRADATVSREDPRWTLTIEIETDSGSRTRTVDADDCDELASMTALLVAIAVDPGLATRPPGAPSEGRPESSGPEAPSSDGGVESEPGAAPESELSSEPEAPPLEVPSDAEPEPSEPDIQPPEPPPGSGGVRGHALAGVGLGIGTLPGVAPVLRLGGGLRWRFALLELSAVYRLPRRVASDRAELWTLAADVRGCGIPHARSVSFPLCLGAELGAIAGRSFDVVRPDRGRAPWILAHADGGVGVALGPRVGIVVDASLVVPLVRAGFEVEGLGVLHRVGPVGLDSTIALHLSFP